MLKKREKRRKKCLNAKLGSFRHRLEIKVWLDFQGDFQFMCFCSSNGSNGKLPHDPNYACLLTHHFYHHHHLLIFYHHRNHLHSWHLLPLWSQSSLFEYWKGAWTTTATLIISTFIPSGSSRSARLTDRSVVSVILRFFDFRPSIHPSVLSCVCYKRTYLCAKNVR